MNLCTIIWASNNSQIRLNPLQQADKGPPLMPESIEGVGLCQQRLA